MYCESSALTNVGMKRTSNEDNFFVINNNGNIAFFAVADGMGGHNAGEVASEIAVNTMKELFIKFSEMSLIPENDDIIFDWLTETIETANRNIYEKALSDVECTKMGTTLTSVLFCNNKLYIGHVGDSRLYKLNKEKIEQITNDHSFVGEQVRLGILTEEEAENHPNKNIITRALGIAETVKIDIMLHEPEIEDIFLICSDGLSGPVRNPQIYDIKEDNLKKYAEKLIEAANKNGGPDNITVVLFKTMKENPNLINKLVGFFKK